MRRREFLALANGAAAWPLIAKAQTDGRMRRIGVLFGGTEGDIQVTKHAGAFSAGLQQLGWIEGKNIEIDYRWARGNIERARSLAKELVSISPALILAIGTEPALALRDTTATVPVVFINVTDPVAGGLVTSLAQPSGNMTGFTPFEYDIGGKWLGLLKEMSPRLTRVAMLGDPVNHNFKGFKRSFEATAQSLSIEPSSIAVHGAEDIERGVGSFTDEGSGGLIITAATFSTVHRDLIINLAKNRKLPAIYWSRSHVAAGGLMSYGPDTADLYRNSATYVDRILKGEKPGDLPVQGPTKVELIINAKTAKSIDLIVPLAMLARADEVIEQI
ncbi:ABC transporter substrate-binding protein [Methylobacterium sp. JK268]